MADVKLVLEDGTTLSGVRFGGSGSVTGEVVFNTAMGGYVEALTDPSYRGQILVATYPLMGNYGVPPARAASSIDGPFESGRIQVQGLVVQHHVAAYSHHSAARSLGEWLAAEQVPGVSGIDTRTLTRRLREHGTMRGWLFDAGLDQDDMASACSAVDMRREVFDLVAPGAVQRFEGGRHRILLVDVGAKDNILRSLLARGATVIRAPWHADLIGLAAGADGIVIGNGPGDPRDLDPLVSVLASLLDTFPGPVFGICLGHQLLARAAGGRTFKLPYGHRGVNQPVQDLLTRRCFVTSQNHGYAVDESSLPADWEPWFVNINDGTCEGVRSRIRPHMAVQFHPEGCPGPKDTEFLFDEFLALVSAYRVGGR